MPDVSLRILVFDLPPLVRDLVRRELERYDDITSVVADTGELERVGDASELERVVAETKPDAVIVPLESDRLTVDTRHFLEQRARLRVLGIGLREGRAALYELRPHRSELGEVAPHELAATVRAAVTRAVTV